MIKIVYIVAYTDCNDLYDHIIFSRATSLKVSQWRCNNITNLLNVNDNQYIKIFVSIIDSFFYNHSSQCEVLSNDVTERVNRYLYRKFFNKIQNLVIVNCLNRVISSKDVERKNYSAHFKLKLLYFLFNSEFKLIDTAKIVFHYK